MQKISLNISRGLDIIDPLVFLRHLRVQYDELEKICLSICLGLELSVKW